MIEHIVDKDIFQEVLQTGAKTKTEHFTLFRMNAPQDPANIKKHDHLMVGVVVPKRLAKRAVTRNAIKRQVYTVANKLAAAYPKEWHVIRLSKVFDKKTYISPSSRQLKLDVCKELQKLYGLGE
jgi:ribonuclease P protein component